MEIVSHALATWDAARPRIALPVERLTLAKRRWRGVAADGLELGFDLTQALSDGAVVFQTATAVYFLAQKYEPVLELPIAAGGWPPGTEARIGWIIGNLHFQIEVTEAVIRVVDDPAVRQLFAREGLAFTTCKRVFHPLTGGHQH